MATSDPDLVGDEFGKRVLDFVERIQQLNDYDEICRCIVDELEWFGFTRVTIWKLPGPGDTLDSGILFDNRPSDYVEHYERENLVLRDPVVVALRSNANPFTWDDVRSQRLTRSDRRIIDEGREFDARNGILVPIRSASGSAALFSPCGREPLLSCRAKTAVEMIGIYSFHALQRAVWRTGKQKQPVPLTSREREVMHWVATGKSDDEIACILHIGRETVVTHVENAKRKLDATRRTYAVVQALRFGEIAL